MSTDYYERRNLSKMHNKIQRTPLCLPEVVNICAFEDLPSLQNMAKNGGYWVIDEYGNREWINLRYHISDLDISEYEYDVLGIAS